MSGLNLIINIVFAAVALVFAVKFFRYKKMVEKEFANFEERLEEEEAKAKEAALKYESEVHYLKSTSGELNEENFKAELKNNGQTPNSPSLELTKLHKEKNHEMKLRMEAEKQVELALQKAENIEQRLNDWKDIQEEYQSESKEMKDHLNNTADHIYEYLDEIVEHIQHLGKEEITKSKQPQKAEISQPNEPDEHTAHNNPEDYHYDLEDILQSNDLEPKVDYFTNQMIDEKVRKSVPCDFFICLDEKNCIIIDSKSLSFFLELSRNKAANSQKAYKIFKQKIDRYINYLTKPKYKSNIVSYFTSRKMIKANTNVTLIMLIPSEEDIDELKKSGNKYLQILQENKIQLHDLDGIDEMAA